MEHAHPIGRSSSWRGLVLAVSLAALGSRALLHRLDGTCPVSDTGRVQKGQGSVAGGIAGRLLAHGYRSALAAIVGH